ncbi:hypothetical protein AMS68_000114 [Peltaster fructicola]|uniref:magnesium chelatase n=1 Tax=Peltaster fructicola TaxID=286661 RepID=A0A6H0XIP4_9PEZI|nr:hypothetical protein AMS68_000114 [Peltaster fructicola]
MDGKTVAKIDHLNDIELTILASLISGDHCTFSKDDSDGVDLYDALRSACRTTFDLEPAGLQCSPATTIDELNDSLLQTRASSLYHAMDSYDVAQYDRRPTAPRLTSDDSLAERKVIANAVILHHLDEASHGVQAQIIELLRTRRMFTRNSMYTAPKDLLLIATLSTPDARLSYHLNDMMASSQVYHQEQHARSFPTNAPSISQEEVERLRLQAAKVRLTAEVDAYLYNLVLCMRLSRYVEGGVSATATRQMRALCKALATMHGIDFVTPSLVMLAARQIYPHRLILATAATEKSLQWGSDPLAVQELLQNSSVAEVINDVIASVETPL